jgi:hypothetical protein
MATRSSYLFIEQNEDDVKNIVSVYFHYDGYPKGHPLKFCDWIKDGEIVDGFGDKNGLQFNGIGCLAAQFVNKFKDGVGGVYLQSVDSFGQGGEDYLYKVIVKNDNEIEFVASDFEEGNEIFRGTPNEFVEKFG